MTAALVRIAEAHYIRIGVPLDSDVEPGSVYQGIKLEKALADAQNDRPASPVDGLASGGHAIRRVRADARRNEEILLDAAKRVFATSGVDAPVREIALEAGVGIATLYRRFPTRSDLIAAVFRREIDACAAESRTLMAEHLPGDALARWLMRFTLFLATKRGLAAALHSGDPTFDPLPAYFRARFEPALHALLTAAAAAGTVRDDVSAFDLLRAIGNLSIATGDDGPDHIKRMVGLLIDGLRHGATSPRNTPGHPTDRRIEPAIS